MNRIARTGFAFALVVVAVGLTTSVASAQPASQPAKRLINVDRGGLALQGYDPVAYFTRGQPVKGSKQFTATHNGGRYQFTSAGHKEMFEKDPAKYEPQFGGYCAYAASINKLAEIGPEYWQIINGRLILQHNRKAERLWKQDEAGNLKNADANWPGLVEKNGK
jgi:YHS domain-containing protein